MPRPSTLLLKIAGRPIIILAIGTSAVLLVSVYASPATQLAFVALLVVVLLALVSLVWGKAASLSEHAELFSTPLLIAHDHQVLDLYRSMAESMRAISSNLDPVYRDLALERLRQTNKEATDVARGHIVFTGTESWRMAYDRLLNSRGLHLYRSIALIKTANYWQDEPGRRSMQANLDLHGERLTIERIAVISDHLWPAAERLPMEPLHTWIDEQHRYGISIKLVRRSTLDNEPDLITDLGIYGNRSVGFQELDEQGRTIRFTLSFDFAEVLAAEARWEKLSLYATPYQEILDRSPGNP